MGLAILNYGINSTLAYYLNRVSYFYTVMLKLFKRNIDNSASADAYKQKLVQVLIQYNAVLALKHGSDEADRHADRIINYIDFQHEFHKKNVMNQSMISKVSKEFIHHLVAQEKSTDEIFEHGNTISEFFEFIMSNAKVEDAS